MSSNPPVLSSRDARGVVTLTLNRPESFNALSEELIAALRNELEAVGVDESVRVVVLAAAGKAFCAGHDLKEMRAAPALGYYERLFADCTRMMLAVQRLPVPVIARVQGVATAAGCQLVAMCDLAVAVETARFAVSGVNLGLFCSTPSVALSRNVSRKAAFEMLVTGAFIGAAEAREKGLVNRVVPADRLDEERRIIAQHRGFELVHARSATTEGKGARQQFVEHSAELIDVGRGRDRVSADLLGRRVLGRHPPRCRVSGRRVIRERARLEQLGQTKVE